MNRRDASSGIHRTEPAPARFAHDGGEAWPSALVSKPITGQRAASRRADRHKPGPENPRGGSVCEPAVRLRLNRVDDAGHFHAFHGCVSCRLSRWPCEAGRSGRRPAVGLPTVVQRGVAVDGMGPRFSRRGTRRAPHDLQERDCCTGPETVASGPPRLTKTGLPTSMFEPSGREERRIRSRRVLKVLLLSAECLDLRYKEHGGKTL